MLNLTDSIILEKVHRLSINKMHVYCLSINKYEAATKIECQDHV